MVEPRDQFRAADDYWDTYAGAIRAIGVADVSAQANRVLRPDNLVWIVVGDGARIEQEIRALGRVRSSGARPVESGPVSGGVGPMIGGHGRVYQLPGRVKALYGRGPRSRRL